MLKTSVYIVQKKNWQAWNFVSLFQNVKSESKLCFKFPLVEEDGAATKGQSHRAHSFAYPW